MLNTVQFGEPENSFKLTPGSLTKSGITSAGISRHFEKDVVEGSDTTRRKASVVLQLSIPSGFTTAEIDNLITDISTFLDPTTLTRILMGES
jgi:hypothetical protein